MLALSSISLGNMTETLQIVFNIFDIDKNGRLTIDEIKKIIGAVYDFLGDEEKLDDDSPSIIVSIVMEKFGEILNCLYLVK